MKTYCTGWMNAASIIGSVGLVVALLTSNVQANGIVAASFGFAAGTFTYLIQQSRQHPHHRWQAIVAPQPPAWPPSP
ncbi:MAG TPA: hypothetical protein VEQ66_07565 [Propionibacteriaceae bacterium]|nr:hypothetical protein [Propionibacteriaceae bacterium]